MNNNLTDGYTDTYNDELDQNQRISFAMEIEAAQGREDRRREVMKRNGGGLDGESNLAQRRGSGHFGGK